MTADEINRNITAVGVLIEIAGDKSLSGDLRQSAICVGSYLITATSNHFAAVRSAAPKPIPVAGADSSTVLAHR